MNTTTTAIITSVVLGVLSPAAWAIPSMVAQATGTAPAPAESKTPPAVGEAASVEVRGTVAAVDKKASTVTLKGPRGNTITLDVKDKAKLDAIKVGDPVVATYVEAIALRIQPPGTAPSASVKEETASSKPGETPAGMVGRQVKAVVTITAIDKAAQTVTIKGPRGRTETVKARDPANLEKIKVGDKVEITYTQALAVAIDRSAKDTPAKSSK